MRDRIKHWPGYQQAPRMNSLDLYKMKIRVTLSLVSQTLIMNSETRRKIKATTLLKGTCSGKLLLVGNGPSADNLTLKQALRFRSLGGKIAVMNGYFKSEISKQLIPDYYFIADPEHWQPTRKVNVNLNHDISSYISRYSSKIIVVQPANQPPLVSDGAKIIYTDHRSVQGLLRLSKPNRPWGLCASIALMSIATLKFLGYNQIFFTGLDSNHLFFYEVDHMNRVVNRSNGQHFYSDPEPNLDSTEFIKDFKSEIPLRPYRHLGDLAYGQGLFMLDLYMLCRNNCINVGNDLTNDSAPRASLLE